MISVIVLSKNNAATLDACLSSIIKSDEEKEIIVVDAHSEDGTLRILQKYRGKVKVVYDEGKGIGIARNLGVQRATGEIICFVDADTVVSKDHFVRILNVFENSPKVGVITVGGIEKTDGKSKVEKMEYMLLSVRRSAKQEIDTPIAGGCFLSIRRKTFNDVGGFWKFPPFGADDTDFGLRARMKGWTIGRVKTASWHQPRASLRELAKEMWGWGKGKACWVKKHGSNPLVLRDYSKKRFWKFLGRSTWVYTVVTYLSAPILALRYVRRSKRFGFIPYYTLRQYAYLLGFLWGWMTWAKKLRNANSLIS